MNKKIFIILCSVFLFVVLSHTVFAFSFWPLVPCGLQAQPQDSSGVELPKVPTQENPDAHDYTKLCNRCDLLKLFKNIIDFVLIGLMPPAAAILFVWGGFLILMGGANPGWISQGKSIFWSTAVGVAIVSGSWLITNTIIRSLADDNVAPEWWKLECRVTTAVQPPPPIPGQKYSCNSNNQCKADPNGTYTSSNCDNACPQPGDICLTPATLATNNSEPYPKKNAPELNSLISCISSRLSGQNLGSQFTYDNSFELCNYSRGQRTCSSCSHAVNSCHYGGRTGNQGALAVDFGNEAIGNQIVQAAQQCGVPSGKARCENAAGVNVGCAPGSGATHVHVSAPSCDAN